MPKGGELHCAVCGYRAAEPPWGLDGTTPSFDYCPCCGVEWGYQDSSAVGIAKYRGEWLRHGAVWRDTKRSKDGLSTTERLSSIGVEWDDSRNS
jgi:hypothetical protein